MPEKSGMDAALCVPLLAPIAGANVCPKADVETAATNIIDKRQSR
jgi:hypothetical protein